MRSHVFVALFVALGVAGVAFGEQLIGAGSSFWAMRTALTTTTACVPTTSGGATCALFSAGSVASWRSTHVAVIAASDNARCCWSGDPGLSLVAGQIALSDAGGPNGTGACAGFSLWPSQGTGRRDVRPSIDDINRRSGARLGICSAATTGAGESLYSPCDADADCTSYGGGTCITGSSITSEMRQGVGAFLLCAADTTANLDVNAENVLR